MHKDQDRTWKFLNRLGVSQVALAEHLDIPVQRINELVRDNCYRDYPQRNATE
jgi:hypothetical protein